MVRTFCSLILLLWLAPASAAERVISLAPSLTEIMQDLQAEHYLVGVLDAGPLAKELESVAKVGSLGQLNIERLLELQPDLLLNWPGSINPRQLQQVQQLDIPIYQAQAKTLRELARQFTEIGALVNATQRGKQLTAQAHQQLDSLEQRYQRKKPIRVFYQLWDKPMYTLGGGQIISDALSYCGAENIFAQLPVLAPQVNLESVLASKPDLIVITHDQLRDSWPEAVKIPMITVPDDGLERPSWQMFSALEKLCQVIDEAIKER